jgi:hypothetical protein
VGGEEGLEDVTYLMLLVITRRKICTYPPLTYVSLSRNNYLLGGCGFSGLFSFFTPLEMMSRCSAAKSWLIVIPAGFNASLEFLTG